MERRREERFKRRFLIKYGVSFPEKIGFSKDISKNGIYITTNNPLKPETILEVKIDTGKENYTLKGKIVRSIRYTGRLGNYMQSGMGVEFTKIPLEYINFIENKIKGSAYRIKSH